MTIQPHPGRVLLSMPIENFAHQFEQKYPIQPPRDIETRVWTVEAIGKGVVNFGKDFPVKIGSRVLALRSYSDSRIYNYAGRTYMIVKPDGIIGLVA